MLQRIESSGSHLAPTVFPGGLASAIELAAGSVVHMPYGDVAADFQPTGTREKNRYATYELRVANDTPAPLATFAYAVEAPGSRSQITWNAIVVPPFSAIAIEIDVAIPRRKRMPRVVAELFSDEAQLTLDAPPQRPRHGVPRGFAAVASAAFLLALGAGSFAATRPRVLALAAPDSVRAGTPFSVAYALADSTDGRYVIETPDGMQIRRGTLADGAGAFTVALPKTALSSGYDVIVSARGRFGVDERSTHVLAVPSRPERALGARRELARETRLGSLSLDRDVVRGGESIVVGYHASNDPGVVRLIDALGTVRAEALLNHRGQSILVAPHVEADQDFRIVATAERGTGHEEVSAPVTVLHEVAPPAVAALAPVSKAVAPAEVGALKAAAPIAVDAEQTEGRPIVIRVDRYQKDLHVALMGASTDEIVGIDVAPGENSVVLTPPDTLAKTRYAIVATYSSGLGQETLVRPITFRAP